MAVFLAASDETYGKDAFGLYHYAGWVAPEQDWYRFFTPAWKERVLDGPPPIPFLHMTQMRSWKWRAQVGISDSSMDDRLDEAARVIDTMGSLIPFKLTIDCRIFRPLYSPHEMIAASGAHRKIEPDFIAFIAYVYAVLSKVKLEYPDAEKVDFVVENNSEITKHIHEFYKVMPDALKHIRRSDLTPLLGGFSAAGKERVPLQAADYLCWHSQRKDLNNLDDIRDLRRWNTISPRESFEYPMSNETLEKLAQAFMNRGTKENVKTNRISKV